MDKRGGMRVVGSAAERVVKVAEGGWGGGGSDGGGELCSKRDLRWVDTRGGIMSGEGLIVVLVVVGGDVAEFGWSGVGGLRMLLNHFWTAEPGELSMGTGGRDASTLV